MNKITKILTILFAAPLFAVSCNFLDVDPLDKFSEKVVFSSPKTVDGYVMSRYDELWFDPFFRWSFRFACDEATEQFNWGQQQSLQKGLMSADLDAGLGAWYQYYEGIQNCNVFMDHMDEIEKLMTDDMRTKEIKTYIAEIRFLRAYFYATLTAEYGDVIFRTKSFSMNTPEDEIYVGRTSYDTVVDFIVEELEEVADDLPIKQPDALFGRATKGAALALKARVLLYAASDLHNPTKDKAKWERAKKATEELIWLNTDGTSDKTAGTKVYTLDPDYDNIFHNSRSPEIIFAKVFSAEHGHNFDVINSPNGFHGWSATAVNQELVDAYEIKATGEIPSVEDLYSSPEGDWKTYEVGTTPWDGRDPRLYVTVAWDGTYWKTRNIEGYVAHKAGETGDPRKWQSIPSASGMDTKESGIEDWNASISGFFLRKFMNPNIGATWDDNSTVPWIYFRYSEFILNYAEILYMLGDEAGCREYVNMIRSRQSVDLMPLTQGGFELWNRYVHERRVELAFEEHRFFDIRRWMNGETEHGDIYGVDIKAEVSYDSDGKPVIGRKTYYRKQLLKCGFEWPKHYLFAIPNSERHKNGNLSQNPEY